MALTPLPLAIRASSDNSVLPQQRDDDADLVVDGKLVLPSGPHQTLLGSFCLSPGRDPRPRCGEFLQKDGGGHSGYDDDRLPWHEDRTAARHEPGRARGGGAAAAVPQVAPRHLRPALARTPSSCGPRRSMPRTWSAGAPCSAQPCGREGAVEVRVAQVEPTCRRTLPPAWTAFRRCPGSARSRCPQLTLPVASRARWALPGRRRGRLAASGTGRGTRDEEVRGAVGTFSLAVGKLRTQARLAVHLSLGMANIARPSSPRPAVKPELAADERIRPPPRGGNGCRRARRRARRCGQRRWPARCRCRCRGSAAFPRSRA